MIISIIGMVICCLVAVAGIYYLVKEKEDKESHKIYGIITAVGIVVLIALLIYFIFQLV